MCERLALGFYTLHTVCCWHTLPFPAALSLLVFGASSWRVEEDATPLVNVLAVCCVEPGTLASSPDGEGILVGGSAGQGWVWAPLGRVVESLLLKCPITFRCSELGVSAPCSFKFATKSLTRAGLIPVTVADSPSLSLAWLEILMLGSQWRGSGCSSAHCYPCFG